MRFPSVRLPPWSTDLMLYEINPLCSLTLSFLFFFTCFVYEWPVYALPPVYTNSLGTNAVFIVFGIKVPTWTTRSNVSELQMFTGLCFLNRSVLLMLLEQLFQVCLAQFPAQMYSSFALSSMAQVICDLDFWMLTAQKSFRQTIISNIVFLEKCVFSICFDLGFSPYNDAFWLIIISIKNPKVQVIWDLGRGSPATLGRKKRTLHVTAPLALTWCTQLFVTVSFVWGGGEREGPWHDNH